MSNQQHYPRGYEQHSQPVPPVKPPKKPMSKEARIGWTILAGFGIFALGATIGAAGGSDPATSAVASSPRPAVTVTVPDNGPTPDPVTTPTNKPTPVAPASKPAPSKTTAAPKPKPIVYKKLTAREWAKIAKSPDAHAGETYIVHGVVTQFDSATGDDQFRADVDGVKHLPEYGYVDYPTNTLMANISGDLSDLVQDDLFTAKVVVVGAFSYDTQIGGETTVPQLSVISITVTGSVK